MGTRGYIVVKFQKKYYRVYNHNDSDPQNLGEAIVSLIRKRKPKAIESYKNYILGLCDKYDIEEDISQHQIDTSNEWTYIIDLDAMTFTIKGATYEPTYLLNSIPENWYTQFATLNHWYSD